MKSVYFTAFLVLAVFSTAFANNYATPGTGVRWNLDDLVTNAGGDVTSGAGVYSVNDTVFISFKDTLYITSDAVVKFAVNSYLDVNGTLIVNPPVGVTFTAQNTTAGYYGMRVDSSNTTVLKKLTFEYAVSLRLSDCNIVVDSCIFRYNNNLASTTFGNGAIALFRSSPVITNSQFLNNQRAAIQGGANVNNAPKIIGCLFQGNNTINSNVPQINLGATSDGTDTVKIINNQILRASTNSGGIGFLPIGNVYAVISGNVIKNNRYGMTFNGGANIYALISYNQVDSNNTQGDPSLGGSGISFTGGTATSQQNSIVTGNLFRWNLWGITIQGRAKPDLGNITNADTSDDGKNRFIGNTNTGTPGIDLYNNTVDPIDAQNNYWGTNDINLIETKIFHKPDNPSLGLVNYSNFLTLPSTLTSFTASLQRGDVVLTWHTATEANSNVFSIERSSDGQSFSPIGTVAATGTGSAGHDYNFTDANLPGGNKAMYYRLKMIDKDDRFAYSPIAVIDVITGGKLNAITLYPTVTDQHQLLHMQIMSSKTQHVTIRFLDANGRLITQASQSLVTGSNYFTCTPAVVLPAGLIYVNFTGEGLQQTIPLLKRL